MEIRGLTLDPRLTALAEMVGSCFCYADIGCDHGRLGAHLLACRLVERAVLSDVSATSLDKARRLIRLLGLEDRALFVVADGARHITGEVDKVVIAGMGGTTISRILREAAGHLADKELILQANVGEEELRRQIAGGGHRIVEERVARDGRRFYVLIQAVPGQQELTDAEAVVGPVLLRERREHFEDLCAFRLRVARKALEGARRGGDEARADALRREIAIWEAAKTGTANEFL